MNKAPFLAPQIYACHLWLVLDHRASTKIAGVHWEGVVAIQVEEKRVSGKDGRLSLQSCPIRV